MNGANSKHSSDLPEAEMSIFVFVDKDNNRTAKAAIHRDYVKGRSTVVTLIPYVFPRFFPPSQQNTKESVEERRQGRDW